MFCRWDHEAGDFDYPPPENLPSGRIDELDLRKALSYNITKEDNIEVFKNGMEAGGTENTMFGEMILPHNSRRFIFSANDISISPE